MNSPDEIRDERMKALLYDAKNIILNNEIILKSSGFNEVQKNQEISKVEWRKQHNELTPNLNKLEDHFLLRGSVSIIGFEGSVQLKQRIDSFYFLFNNKADYIKISRALLTIDDYSQLFSWKFLFGNNSENTWRELFTESKQRKYFDKTKETLLKLLDSIAFSTDDEYLETLISTYLSSNETIKDWKFYFIKYPKMREGRSGAYWWRNDSEKQKENQYEVFMMNTPTKLSGRHWDPFLYEIASNEDFKDTCSLDEYGAPLIIKSKNTKIKCMNNAWTFYDAKDTFIKDIEIPQDNGIDLKDRIELLKTTIKQELANASGKV